MSISYKDAGVDVHRGYAAVEMIKRHVASTHNDRVLGDLGSFGGFFDIAGLGGNDPVLVSGTDGVGTKLRYAFALGQHDTIGIDAVAMCVNDIVCQGAQPLFFLDYFACGHLVPEVVASVVSGVAEGCRMCGCALIGGETAEMPSFYADGEYDIAGFAVGIVDRARIINGSRIQPGDAIIGLASSGLHSNGFSLVRKLLGCDPDQLRASGLDAEVMRPTRIYVRTMLELARRFDLRGVAHITGGGWLENIPRMLPSGVGAQLDTAAAPVLPIFEVLRQRSGLNREEMYNTFNMGIGMVLCVPNEVANDVIAAAEQLGERACVIGRAVEGQGVSL